MIQGGEWETGGDAERGTADCSVPAATDAEGSGGRIRRGKVGTKGSRQKDQARKGRNGRFRAEGSGAERSERKAQTRKGQARKGRNGRLRAEESDAEGSRRKNGGYYGIY